MKPSNLLFTLLVCACVVGEDESSLPSETDDEPLADENDGLVLAACSPNAALSIKVAQINICEGGRWQNCVSNRVMNYGTQDELVDRMTSGSLAGIAVLGVEEIPPADGARLAQSLSDRTGNTWSHSVTPMGVGGSGSGVGIFWRTDLVSLAADLGYRQIESLGGYPNGQTYSLRFKGLLLKHNASGRTFGMFTGKTAWGGKVAGTNITIDNNRRAVEAARVNAFVREAMAPYPNSSMMLAIDTTPEGTPAYATLNSKFFDGNPQYGGTHPAINPTRRYDQLFWDYDSGSRRTCGFVDGPHRSSPFGSDHRFVWATVSIK